jgi:Uma2 family endonuclease
LIDPDEQSVSVYRPQSPPETLRHITRIEGESPVSGFVLDLEDIWKGL